MQEVFLLCGVPGSGKTWAAQRLAETGKFRWVKHGDFKHDWEGYVPAVIRVAELSSLPVLAELPLRWSERIKRLKAAGLTVRIFWVSINPFVLRQRYAAREGKHIPEQHVKRMALIPERVKEFGGHVGDGESCVRAALCELDATQHA